MYKFSVITPVHLWNSNRVEMFEKTIESLKNQTFRNFNWIVVDDGSTEDFNWTILQSFGFPVLLIKKSHEERVIAYNRAFEQASGEWITLLDGDDEYDPQYLEKLAFYIDKYPKEKMFNFGCVYQHKDGTTNTRDSFVPKKLKVGHEKFGGGNIVNGTYIFKKEIYDKLGAYPGDKDGFVLDVDCSELNYNRGEEQKRDLYMGSPYDFSAAAQLEFPEIREYFMVDHENEPNKVLKELGNPWGQDYYLFYKYTRKYHSMPINEYLYRVNPR